MTSPKVSAEALADLIALVTEVSKQVEYHHGGGALKWVTEARPTALALRAQAALEKLKPVDP